MQWKKGRPPQDNPDYIVLTKRGAIAVAGDVPAADVAHWLELPELPGDDWSHEYDAPLGTVVLARPVGSREPGRDAVRIAGPSQRWWVRRHGGVYQPSKRQHEWRPLPEGE